MLLLLLLPLQLIGEIVIVIVVATVMYTCYQLLQPPMNTGTHTDGHTRRMRNLFRFFCSLQLNEFDILGFCFL